MKETHSHGNNPQIKTECSNGTPTDPKIKYTSQSQTSKLGW